MLNLNKIYNQDCLEVMKDIPDKSVDLVVTDPPYLMNYRSNRRVVKDKFEHIANDVDSKDLIISYLKEAHRILKDNTALYCFCSWHKIDFFKQEIEKLFTIKNIIVWNKNNHGSGDLTGGYAPKYEFIIFAHKGRSLHRTKRKPDVIDCAKIDSSRLTHPTEKPIALLKIFIENNSDVNDVVFDGFAGTSATLIASKILNRSFIGVELEQKYVDICNKRIMEVKSGCDANDDGIPPNNKLLGILPTIL